MSNRAGPTARSSSHAERGRPAPEGDHRPEVDLDAALAHIRRYSSGHSETIVTELQRSSQRFTAEVDAAAVYVNASTRFTDGGELGLGGEIGISTQKLHARGPIGLAELTTYTYLVTGRGHVR